MANIVRLALLLLAVIVSSRAVSLIKPKDRCLNVMSSMTRIEKKIDDLEKAVYKQCNALARHCAELYKKGYTTDGIYQVDPDGQGPIKVRCDMTTSGGGWTIIQRRVDGSVSFQRNWKDYMLGFGDHHSEFWLGLEHIKRMTNMERMILRVDMGDTTGDMKHAAYDFFAVASKMTKYKLSLGAYSGNAGDALVLHDGMEFSTHDQDNDKSAQNCAQTYKGGWWYNACHKANLNGFYYLGPHTSYADGVNWHPWKGYNYSLREVEMKIRPFVF
ncbi:techylectin-5B-like [Dendronephthya gigantea]|uniref:techylectin-5B-like n=1 Tax=Dendronephthya gigantea TaxID=151771 RepID=UPI0010694995|nr:techylectin-5B-like [Dendronephthya gigantea]